MNIKNVNPRNLIKSLCTRGLKGTELKYNIKKEAIKNKCEKYLLGSYRKSISFNSKFKNHKRKSNKIIHCNKYAKIIISKDEVIINSRYVELVKKYYWFVDSTGYCRTGKGIHLHKYLFDKRNKYIIDHINRDKLDNRICNIRRSDKSNNNYNKDFKIGASGHRGVRISSNGKYYASITRGRVTQHGKYRKTLEEAVKDRKKMEFETYGYSS